MPIADPFRPGLLHRLEPRPQNICIFKASRIGDFLCALPAMRALSEALPDARQVLITLPLLRPLAERIGCFDEVVDFPGFPGIAEQLFDARRATAFFVRMQDEAFDLAIQLQGSGVHANPFILMLGARAAAGFVRPGDGPGLLDAALPLPGHGHETERMAALARFLGAMPRDTQPRFPLDDAARRAAATMLGSAIRPLICIHAGARDPARRWAPEHFAEVARALVREFGASLVVVGEAGDAHATDVARLLGRQCIDLTGRTGLLRLGAVIERCDLLLTTDSGPAHIAYALGTPALVVFSYEPLRYGPPGPPHRIAAVRLTAPATDAGPAPEAVAASTVLQAAAEMLGKRYPPTNPEMPGR